MKEFILVVVPGIFSGLVLWYIKRMFEKRDKLEEAKEELRAKNNTLILKGVSASLSLAEATAEALVTKVCNGKIDLARNNAREVKREIEDFTISQYSRLVNK